MLEPLYSKMGFTSQGVKNFPAREAFELCSNGAMLLDVREDYMIAFKKYMVKRVVNIPYCLLEKEFSSLLENDFIICADSVGLKSLEATKLLLKKGYRHVANLPGGIVDWESEGFPVETSKKERLSGSCMCQLKPREIKK